MPTVGRGPVTLAELTAGLVWPRLLRAVPIAAHPVRLGVATVAVVIFMGLGIGFDQVRGPIAPPDRLVGDVLTPVEQDIALSNIVRETEALPPDRVDRLLAEAMLDARTVRDAIQRSLVERLDELDRGAGRFQEAAAEARAQAVAALTRVDAVPPRGLFRATVSEVVTGFNQMARGAVSLDAAETASGVRRAFFDTPRALLTHYPLSGGAVALLFIVIFSLAGAAICRGAACEAAGEVSPGGTESLAFAVPRWRRAAAPFFILAVVIGALAFGLAAAGGVLLSVPGLNVVGALLWGLFLIGGLVLVALCVGAAVAGPMFIPAIAVESTDAVDAIQRAYAYVLGTPGRMILYAATLLAQGAVAYAVVGWIAATAMNWTGALAAAWAGPLTPVAGEVEALRFTLPERTLGLSGVDIVAGELVEVWDRVLMAALAGFVISFFFCASTMLYLLLRRINDGQDVEEIWTPGMIEGTMAPEAPMTQKASPELDRQPED